MEAEKKSKLSEDFTSKFLSAKELIRNKIDELSNSRDLDVITKLNSIAEELQNLSKSLQDSTLFLPLYSVKVRQNEIRALEQELKAKEELLIPKKKFGFKSKIVKPIPTPVIGALPHKKHEKAQENDDSNFLTIENVEQAEAPIPEYKLNKADVLVRNLDGAIVQLNGSPSTLRLSNLTNCKLICGPVYTSIFVDDCKNCVLFLCCQQLRTHSSQDLDIYLRVRSRAIIEDCSKIRFAPYNWKHERSEELHKLAEIDVNLNRFDAVDDFNWLAFTTPSPNWTILPEAERIDFPMESSKAKEPNA